MHPMLRVALESIRKASKKILSQYDRIDPSSNIRMIDNLSQHILIEELSSRYPYLHFIAEESEKTKRSRGRISGRTR